MSVRRRRAPEVDPDELIAAYHQGAFPMDAPERAGGPIEYFTASPRAVLPIGDGFRVPRTIRRRLRAADHEIRVDRDFTGVLDGCADRAEGTWLSPRLARAYRALHERGIAHSVEAWRNGRLVGGLFGMSLGGLFSSESMFHRADDAGNAVLVATHALLAHRGFELWDIQMASPHTMRFGAIELTPEMYRHRLAKALAAPQRDLGPASGPLRQLMP